MRTILLGLLVLPSWAGESTDLTKAIELPARADGLRKAGVEEGQLREALQAARDENLAADEAEEVLEPAEKAAKENGPVDNFGAFVRERLHEGLRGRELARAIHEEHQKNGKGRGHGPDGERGKGPDGEKGGKGRGPDGGKGQGPDGEKGGKGKGPDGDKGQGPDGNQGKPDDKGKEGKGQGGKGKGKNK